MKSFPTKTSSKNSTKAFSSNRFTVSRTVAGITLHLEQAVVGSQIQTVNLPEIELAKIPPEAIIKVEALPEPPVPQYPGKEPELEKQEEHAAWLAHKTSWEQQQLKQHEAEKEKQAQLQLKRVTLNVPITRTYKVTMDGHQLMVYHTLRGPVIGKVVGEDSNRVTLFSPCFLDPNITPDKIHYMPMAFAGEFFTLYRSTCLGESVPQETEAMGYPEFIKRNQEGHYQFRSRSAYHHVCTDTSDDIELVSVTQGLRTPYFGLIPTSDTAELYLIEQARRQQK